MLASLPWPLQSVEFLVITWDSDAPKRLLLWLRGELIGNHEADAEVALMWQDLTCGLRGSGDGEGDVNVVVASPVLINKGFQIADGPGFQVGALLDDDVDK